MTAQKKEQLLEKRIYARFGKACKDYSLLQDGDKILIGVSGGKDSLALLHMMARQSRIYKPRIEILAAHVGMKNIPYKTDLKYLEKICSAHNVKLIYDETSFDASTDNRKSPCFLCSWNRRKSLFTIAQQHNCNKIALGHNMDDFLETMLMNITFQGAFSAMAPLMQMRKFPIAVIRPLCLANENDLQQFAIANNYPPQIKNCPYEKSSNRQNMKEFLQKLEQLNPEARYNLWSSMSNIQSELLPPATKQDKP